MQATKTRAIRFFLKAIVSLVSLAPAAPALAQKVLSDVECRTVRTEDSVRVTCYDHAGRERPASAGASTDAEALAARCARAERGERGWNIQGCAPTKNVCAVAALDGYRIAGCEGVPIWGDSPNLELLSNNALQTNIGPGAYPPRFIISCTTGTTTIALWPGAALEGADFVIARVKWDEGAPTDQEWTRRSTEKAGDSLSPRDPEAFLRRLGAHARLAVEVMPRRSAPWVLYFTMGGEALKHLPTYRQQCEGGAEVVR